MSLIKSFNSYEEQCFQLMVSLHIYTKKYLLIAEEIAEKGEIFIQPLKEQRVNYRKRAFVRHNNKKRRLPKETALKRPVITYGRNAC